MRIAGIRLQPTVARLLAEILDGAGFRDTAFKVTDAIERGTTTEVALTLTDHEAILVALGGQCPTTLARLRRELLEEQRRLRALDGG